MIEDLRRTNVESGCSSSKTVCSYFPFMVEVCINESELPMLKLAIFVGDHWILNGVSEVESAANFARET